MPPCYRKTRGYCALTRTSWTNSAKWGHAMRAVVFMTLLLLCCARPALAADLSKMYTRDTLQKDAMRLRTAVGKIYNLGIKPNLTAAERDELEFRFPMPKTGDDPLNFYAYRDGRKAIVVMPVLSLKTLEDLTTAYAWVQVNDLLHSTIDLYYSALRHRPLSKFPENRYPDVLSALDIPQDAYEQPGVDSLSLSLRNEAYGFIIVHEFAHVLFRHKGYAEITKAKARADEVQADRFALEVLARSATPPMGAVFYFQAQVYRFRHRGEFPTDKAWDDYLMTVATHPMTVDRLKAMSRYISGQLAAKRGAEKDTCKGVGALFSKVAGILEDHDIGACTAKVAAEAPWHVLKPGASDPRWALEQFCGGR